MTSIDRAMPSGLINFGLLLGANAILSTALGSVAQIFRLADFPLLRLMSVNGLRDRYAEGVEAVEDGPSRDHATHDPAGQWMRTWSSAVWRSKSRAASL